SLRRLCERRRSVCRQHHFARGSSIGGHSDRSSPGGQATVSPMGAELMVSLYFLAASLRLPIFCRLPIFYEGGGSQAIGMRPAIGGWVDAPIGAPLRSSLLNSHAP